MFYAHRKTGHIYKSLHMFATVEATGDQVAVYENAETGSVYIRPMNEFLDARRFWPLEAKGLKTAKKEWERTVKELDEPLNV